MESRLFVVQSLQKWRDYISNFTCGFVSFFDSLFLGAFARRVLRLNFTILLMPQAAGASTKNQQSSKIIQITVIARAIIPLSSPPVSPFLYKMRYTPIRADNYLKQSKKQYDSKYQSKDCNHVHAHNLTLTIAATMISFICNNNIIFQLQDKLSHQKTTDSSIPPSGLDSPVVIL